MVSGALPRSLPAFRAARGMLPTSLNRLPSLTAWVIRACARPPAVCAKAAGHDAKPSATAANAPPAIPRRLSIRRLRSIVDFHRWKRCIIIGAVPGVRGVDGDCTGAWYAEWRRRYYQIMLGLEQMEPVSADAPRRLRNTVCAQHFGGNGDTNDRQRRAKRGNEVSLNPESFAGDRRS